MRKFEIFLLVLALALATFALNNKRSYRVNEREFGRMRDSLNQELSQGKEQISYLLAWLAASHADTSIQLAGTTTKGDSISLSLATGAFPTVLYSMDPSCSSCLANIPYLSALARQKPCGTRVVGVLSASDETGAAFDSMGVAFPILTKSSGKAWRVLPLVSAPTTFVILPGGKLQGWWRGELTLSQKRNIDTKLARSCNVLEHPL